MIELNDQNRVDARNLFTELGIKRAFSTWIKDCIQSADLELLKDFTTFTKESTGGRPTIEYQLNRDAALSITMMSGGKNASTVRKKLIELFNHRENKDLLSHDEVVMLSVLKNFFKYVENQKSIQKIHLDKHVAESQSKGNKFAEFNVWRNNILGIEKEDLDAKIKAFCIENSKRLPNIKSNSEKILFLNEYDSLRNAVWDFLKVQGNFNAEKLSGLVKRIAETENLQCYRTNEDDLFRKKENINLSLNQ